MDISLQLLSFIFSFSYGIIISYLVNLCYNFLYKTRIIYRIFINILFSINLSLIYFLLIKVINNGVIHIYFIFTLLLGYFLFINKFKNLRNIVKLKQSYKKPIEKNK